MEGNYEVIDDDKSTINIVKLPIQYDHIKHVEVDRHFIK